MTSEVVEKLIKAEPFLPFLLFVGSEELLIDDPKSCQIDRLQASLLQLHERSGAGHWVVKGWIDLKLVYKVTIKTK